ncbi:hypothetical protein B0H66DRAFT_180595 [Apodospora peruviana]|uniref:Extracellular membrane protein CFEM domain-containing protein n=1 Tax=Apodospora peruviana TaxID=516989 RepID=A0AAE0M7U9_9PEZI|nr:hypothetical protein B0H66DRAFT_180595 [Apodospora peruviana]
MPEPPPRSMAVVPRTYRLASFLPENASRLSRRQHLIVTSPLAIATPRPLGALFSHFCLGRLRFHNLMLTSRLFVAALAAATLCAAQVTDCEDTCNPKLVAATKCETLACGCYAYDDPDYVSCLKSECGRGFSSIRDGQVLACSYMGVTLTPDPPSADGSSDSQTTSTAAASDPQTTSGTTSGGGSSSGSGGAATNGGSSGSTSTDSGSGSQSSGGGKSGLSTAELIGIVIGAISAVAGIIGVWVAIHQGKARRNARAVSAAPPVVYQPIPPPMPTYPSVQNIHVAPVVNNHHGQYQQPPPNYQPPPAYQPVNMGGWQK